MEQLQEFVQQLPPPIQEKLSNIEDPGERNQVIQNLMQRAKAFDDPKKVDIEAERNENVTVSSASKPISMGGKLIKKSENPVSGETTYEIPNDGSSASHKDEGVDIRLEPGSVVNSDKFKIDTDFKIGSKNFKGKSHKDASDYISAQEEKIQKRFNELEEKGMVDKISEESLGIMLTKLAAARKELNNRQESALNLKKQKEKADFIQANLKEFGGHVKDLTKTRTLARNKAQQFLDSKVGLAPVVKAANGMQVSIDKFNKFADKIKTDTSLEEFMSEAHQSGILPDLSGRSFQAPENVKVHGDLRLRANYANNFFINKGYTPVQAAGLVGNLMQESNLNPTITNSIGAFGIAQWYKDRKINFKTWAEQNGLNPYDMDTQLTYVDHELSTSHASVAKQLAGAKTVEEATMIVRKKYEIPGEKEAKDGKRLGYAKYVYGLGTANLGQRNSQKFEQGGFVEAERGRAVGSDEKNSIYFKDAKPDATQEDQKQLASMLKRILGKDMKYNDIDFEKKRRRTLLYSRMVNPLTDYYTKVFGNPGVDTQRTRELDLYDWRNQGYEINNWNLEKNKDRVWEKMTESLLKSAYTRMKSYPNTSEPSEPNPPNIASTSSDGSPRDQARAQNDGMGADGKYDDSTSSDPASESSIMDRIKYGLKNAAPYLNALPRMFERIIPPVLQQDNYHNPADYINTDVSVQSQLNEGYRNSLLAQEQAGGNPSVRNARLAQQYANQYNANNELLTNKYNQEQQLKTQKGVAGTEYLNQWEKSNQGLRKRFEQEWLQALEAKRQQVYATGDYMTNVGLRKAEDDRAIQLGLSNTVYDYDPIKGTLIPNKDKVASYNQIERFINSGSSGSNEKFNRIAGTSSYWYKDNNGKIRIANMDGDSDPVKP